MGLSAVVGFDGEVALKCAQEALKLDCSWQRSCQAHGNMPRTGWLFSQVFFQLPVCDAPW